MTQTTRSLLGFFLAPLVPCLIIIVAALFTGGTGVEFWIMLILPTSYAVSLFIGGPIHCLLIRYKRTGILYYLGSAILVSSVPIFYVFLYGNLMNDPASMFEGILPVHYAIMGFMVFIGILISATFWFIARPDRSAA